MPFLLLYLELAGALPFVTTWRTTEATETIVPPILPMNDVIINWGDATTSNVTTGPTAIVLNHTYAASGLHNISINGPIFWDKADSQTTRGKLLAISNWGDGFLVQTRTSLFEGYPNLQVSASPDTQPVLWPGASLLGMFRSTSFNSPLNWNLTNATSLESMFEKTPLNQPINFRNTQNIQSTYGLFQDTPYFNQPFHFDASGLTTANSMFYNTSSFNQIVNLTNSTRLTNTAYMFVYAASFNQPIAFNTSSVTNMVGMFGATKQFNQPITFDTSQATDMGSMFFGAEAFNQPINLNTPNLRKADSMFTRTRSFNQPVMMNTSSVTSMVNMFANASNFSSTVTFTSTAKVTAMNGMFDGVVGFTQDLSSWGTQNVTQCDNFCPRCALPAFPSCSPCPVMRYTVGQVSMCSSPAPSLAPSAAPSTTPSAAPSIGPSSVSAAAPAGDLLPTALVWAVSVLPFFLMKL